MTTTPELAQQPRPIEQAEAELGLAYLRHLLANGGISPSRRHLVQAEIHRLERQAA